MMRFPRTLLLYLCFPLLFTACGEPLLSPPDEGVGLEGRGAMPQTLQICSNRLGFVQISLNPPVDLPLTWDSLNLYGYGNAYLDIDGSGHGLTFSLRMVNADSMHLIGMDDLLSEFRVQPDPGVEMAQYETLVYYGLGSWAEWNSVERFDCGEVLDRQDQVWEHRDQVVWRESPEWVGEPFGPWYDETIGYMGFRMRGTRMGSWRYGWIKMDNSDRSHPEILGVTYQL